MTCIYCEGTGRDDKHKCKCGVCEGTGQVCDTCGESIPDDGDYLCTDCDKPGDK
jgi:RecJ-like exonuclease